MYQVSLQQFTGPLDLLLHLVEKRNLEITEISLSQITQDYLDYLTHQSINPTELADFLVIASTLLLIKSKALLPDLELKTEEEEEINNLEKKLKVFKLFKEQSQMIIERYQEHKYLFCRPPWVGISKIFQPPADFDVNELAVRYRAAVKDLSLENPGKEEKRLKKIISLKQRIKELLHYLTQGKKYSFNDLIDSKKNKIELIVTFLAILHLIKEGLIFAKQKENFGEIWISST